MLDIYKYFILIKYTDKTVLNDDATLKLAFDSIDTRHTIIMQYSSQFMHHVIDIACIYELDTRTVSRYTL